MLNKILELIYPNVCGICDKLSKECLCKKCEIKLKNETVLNFLDYSTSNKHSFDYHIYLFNYQGTIREKLIDYKFNEKNYLYKTFAKIITKNEKICGFFKNYDIILPVPISKKRKLKRGYNQTELIAKEIAKSVPTLEINTKLLLKNKNNLQQSNLTKKQRKENVKNVYILKNIEKIKDRNIIIFDDIYTTGSTVEECSKLLKKSGAKKIAILTIAKD